MKQPVIFLVDDDKSLRLSVRQCLECSGFHVREFERGEAVLACLNPLFDGVVLSDVRMPGMDGLVLLRHILEIDADIPVILITAHGDVPMAVDAMQQGAYDFVEKPFDEGTLTDILGHALEKRQLVLELRRIKTDLDAAQGLDARLVGAHPSMRAVKRKIMEVAPTSASVLLSGETGTGKEVAARCLHDCSPRADKPFVVVDCASIPSPWRRASFLAMCAARLPARTEIRWASWKRRREARCSLMKSTACLWSFRASCCAPCRKSASRRWARTRPAR